MRLKLRRISTGFLLVTGGSGHQAVKFRVPGELVGEGDDGAAHPDQAVTGLGAGAAATDRTSICREIKRTLSNTAAVQIDISGITYNFASTQS